MDQNAHDFDKTTIRVELSDAYQDIIIDWSKELDDIEKEMFRQLAEFTGIPIEKTFDIVLLWPPIGNNVLPDNLGFLNPSYEDRPQGNHRRTNEDYRNKFFGDDNCFALNTKMEVTITLDKLYVVYNRLVHRDLIDETECNSFFCHHSSNRAFLDKQAKIMNSNFESYLRDQPRPDLEGIDNYDVIYTRKREILADLNIGQYFDSYCKLSHSNARTRIYCPNRG